ncbi:MAG: multidrug transporter [Bacteroidia bacterium]|nr:MAG: multidrug transporter [Bacteroidia bacterium]
MFTFSFTNSQKGHLSLFSAQVIYALNYSIAKDIMPKYLHPISLVFLRIFGACILFWGLSFFISSEKQNVSKDDIKKTFWLSLFGVIINQFFFIYGLSITTPINSAIIMISNPIIVFLLSLFIFNKNNKVSFQWKHWLGLISGIAGALTLILFKGNFNFGSDTWVGDVMTLLNSASWALFLIYGKDMLQKYHTVAVMKYMFLWGTIVFFPVAVFFLFHEEWQNIPISIYWAIAFVVLATTFIAYLLNTYGLKLMSTSVVSMYIYMQPFLATLFAVMFGKDTITITKIIAGSFVLLGIYLVNTKK